MIQLNVSNFSKFFETIDRCENPILIVSPDGKQEDLRNNTFLRYVLESSRPENTASALNLQVSGAGDYEKLLNYAFNN